ncbi:MAG: HlyD family efflux transporter periplasmic adaptor subunit [Burkholderiaceae bacterium]|nr:HlyD family efflux transporter periplasmic adaptor subunit [Burkholderiaceae bacterium]
MHAPAPVYSLADEHRSRAEAAAWSRFTAPEDSSQFFAAWLSLLCSRVEHARAALLLVADASPGSYRVAAAWPDAMHDLQYLGPAAQRALTEGRGLVVAVDDRSAHVGYPVEVTGRLCGAVVLDVFGAAQAELQVALRQLHWGSAWLVDHFRQQELSERQAELQRVTALNELMATALQHRLLQPSALATANDLAARLRCDRVSIGFEEAGRVVPLVMSHTATFDVRSDLVRTLGEAMDEVLDLGVAVVWPAHDDEFGALAHAEAARALHVQALLSVPLLAVGETVGVLVLERNAGPVFDAAEQRLARALGVMLGPVWAVQRANERNPWQRLRDAVRSGVRSTFGPRHPGLKLIAGTAAAFLLVVSLVHVDHRVSARTLIEGSVQAAAVAPFEGYVAEGLVRAGDTVRRGQPLARLDERDLLLERARWSAEREQLQRRFQVAMASADRGTMGVLAAQIDQVDAQLSLAQEKLARATLFAPFDGLVVSGDLSQQIGSPVEQGKLLFEVAPLQGFRVVLQVDDRDISYVATGQAGALVLSSLPDQSLPFTVSAITPVATQHDGRNVFRVEAQIDGAIASRLRPGMEGIGKVTVGEGSLLWIWTRGFVDWLRLATWSWLP